MRTVLNGLALSARKPEISLLSNPYKIVYYYTLPLNPKPNLHNIPNTKCISGFRSDNVIGSQLGRNIENLVRFRNRTMLLPSSGTGYPVLKPAASFENWISMLV